MIVTVSWVVFAGVVLHAYVRNNARMGGAPRKG